MAFSDRIKSNPRLKKFFHWLLIPTNQARPRLWVRVILNRFYHQKGKNVIIRSWVRMDVLPFNPFSIGDNSMVEDFTTINNGVGEVRIGNNSLIGLGNVIIGPITVGNNVILAQNIVASGLNHNYADIRQPIHQQGVSVAPIVIEDDCWIGANTVITAGVRIGKHCVIAAGAVVTKNIPPYSVAVGNPARVIKQYDASSDEWIKTI
ncbi:acyltransferase [Dyadobacter chenhuakuii]|jgi:acetyltransferase-like isoleucine patch superfamily enzyme|uniref:Acyltransferase n=2 Tax=Spirosomataceae TaxID=2896860 RepID=A0A9X1QAV1_9BACT|nr:acyltransferase [Dyadobacter chenhuakuii]MCF2497027.1 acyltransferase [Dyadobacter chenhuakuii]